LDFSESGKPLSKIGKPLKKAESHCGKQKAIEESWKAVEENWILGGGKLDFRRGKSRYFPRGSLVSGNFGDSFSYAICYHVCARIYFVALKYSQVK
jgi:hypothetical protein